MHPQYINTSLHQYIFGPHNTTCTGPFFLFCFFFPFSFPFFLSFLFPFIRLQSRQSMPGIRSSARQAKARISLPAQFPVIALFSDCMLPVPLPSCFATSCFSYLSGVNQHMASVLIVLPSTYICLDCNMQASQQPHSQAGFMQHNTTSQPSTTGYPRAGGYGPMGHIINRMQQQHRQPAQPFPPPPPPHLPPPPGFFSPHSPSLSPPPATLPSLPVGSQRQLSPPPDFISSQTHWDTRSVFRLDLPRFVKHTPHTEANHSAGLPITDITLLQTVRHGWNSYWLRYIAHGHSTGLLFTKHINEAMFASEFFSVLRSKKIDLDIAAIIYCHQYNIPAPTKQQALAALVTEFVDYFQDVWEALNTTSQASPDNAPRAPPKRPPQQTDPATAQRLATLEYQLAAANLTINHLRGQPTPQPTSTFTTTPPPPSTSHQQQPPPHHTHATSADLSPIAPRNLQQQIDALERELAEYKNQTPTPTASAPSVVDITASPTRVASQETTSYSPSPH